MEKNILRDRPNNMKRNITNLRKVCSKWPKSNKKFIMKKINNKLMKCKATLFERRIPSN